MRTITIIDENSIIQEQFVVSNKDAEQIAEDFDTGWMDEDEFKEYLKDGE